MSNWGLEEGREGVGFECLETEKYDERFFDVLVDWDECHQVNLMKAPLLHFSVEKGDRVH